MGAGQSSKVIKSGVKGRGHIRSTVRIPHTSKDFTKLNSKRGKKPKKKITKPKKPQVQTV